MDEVEVNECLNLVASSVMGSGSGSAHFPADNHKELATALNCCPSVRSSICDPLQGQELELRNISPPPSLTFKPSS